MNAALDSTPSQLIASGIFSIEYIIAESKPAPEPPPKPKAKRGRPLKRDAAYYQAIWDTFCSMAGWFLEKHGRPHRSVPKLIEAYYTDLFMRHGFRGTRVNSPEVRGRMKTLENDISKAKKHYLPRP